MTRRLLVLGAGTAGTMIANRMRRVLDARDWEITIVDKDDVHLYQPGFLFLPFATYRPDQVRRSRHTLLADGIDLVLAGVEQIDAGAGTVTLGDGRVLAYDQLVITTGTSPRPDQTPGMLGDLWRRDVFDFYTFDGAMALQRALQQLTGGRLVVHVTDMPIKCPVAPLEFVFLADAWLRARGMRERTELVFATPLSGAFTQPVAAERLGSLLADRDIRVETDYLVERIDEQGKALVSYDERRIDFDLLVTVPLNMGAEVITRSGLGDELGYVPVDRHTLRSRAYENVFVVGDAADLPTSKAGSVAHFAVETFVHNFPLLVEGREPVDAFDGHANCFVETGNGKGLLIDFDYDTQPLPGTYPLPWVGPMRLLTETRANHLGKLAFRWLYWNALLPGRPIPLPAHMSMRGKDTSLLAAA
ncbi:type III sulfide quinone reductase, selenoprotein subtype [Cellulomonas soli]|nr:FAD/NAD(P)-binding oxidoreductase [Cellulomonas soli]NYI57668.1 sulfide:quinone oxidoreductase [Cellulomonas soli]